MGNKPLGSLNAQNELNCHSPLGQACSVDLKSNVVGCYLAIP